MKKILKLLIEFGTFFYNLTIRPNIHSTKVSIFLKIGNKSKVLESSIIDKNSEIGNYSFISSNVIITKSKIGNYCSIAPCAKIGLGEHDYHNISTSVRFIENPYQELTKKECKLGNDVWVGTNAVILRGVTIGDGAVIGANAVVTKDIPPFAIAVGAPTRILKYRFSEDKINKIIASKWWDYSLLNAQIKIKELEND